MPHGPPTPLGRQLRTVLAAISPPSLPTVNALPISLSRSYTTVSKLTSTSTSVPPARSFPPLYQARHVQRDRNNGHRNRSFHSVPVTRASTAHATQLIDEQPGTGYRSFEDGRRFRNLSRRMLKRHTRTDHLTDALKDTGHESAVPKLPGYRPNLSYVNVQSRLAWKGWRVRERRERGQSFISKPSYGQSHTLSLQSVLASFIRHVARSRDYLEAEWNTPFELSPTEADFLYFHGFSLDHLASWADIVSSEDALDAATKLAGQATRGGPESIPTFVYMHILRRQHINAEALRILVSSVSHLFTQRAHRLRNSAIDNQPLFLAIVRLIRHAREVWPEGIPSISNMMLQQFRRQESVCDASDNGRLSAMTYTLNKLMSLISISTAVAPYKDSTFQESAIVAILRFMAQHSPSLHIDRQGYRAVVRVQLSQRKTRHEQQWADLKALSWPPWKVERTAMDASIDIETYGSSRAAATLAQMRQAGYASLEWEKVAQILAGWDSDRTPTMQVRALLDLPGSRLSQALSRSSALWVARIKSTRTIQEAWACYLSWEDSKLPLSQDGYLAIAEKLQAEDKRQDVGDKLKREVGARPSWTLQPGDSREVSPLPPSTHLYTYTRTPPPTLGDFCETLLDRGVVFEGYFLAFIVHHARTLPAGMRYLQNCESRHPWVSALLTADATHGLDSVPLPILSATIALYTRFANIPLSKAMPTETYRPFRIESQKPLMSDQRLSSNNCFTMAIELLRARPVPYRPLWNTVFRGLTLEANFSGLSRVFSPRQSSPRILHAELSQATEESQRWAGAVNAYRLFRRILALMCEHRIDLDIVGFQNLCRSTEHATVASWAVLQKENNYEICETLFADVASDERQGLVRQVKAILRSSSSHQRLKGEFALLVGQPASNDSNRSQESEQQPSINPGLPSVRLPALLTTPNPATLHAYIRALGWLADYDGLFATICWMRDHRHELAERQSRDRRGQDMMRKAMVALRVFLERSWLSDNEKESILVRLEEEERNAVVDSDGVGAKQVSTPGPGRRGLFILARLTRPATPQLIAAVKKVVEEVPEWEGWPSAEEVEAYAADRRFQLVSNNNNNKNKE